MFAEEALTRLRNGYDKRRWAETPASAPHGSLTVLSVVANMHNVNWAKLQVCRNSFSQLSMNNRVFDNSLPMRLTNNAVSRYGRLEASFAIDHVYSLLGISSDLAMRPEYSRRTEDVFVEVAQHLFDKSKAVSLGFCGIDPMSACALPLWVPD